MTKISMYHDKYNNSMWSVEKNAMQETGAFRLPLDRPFRLRPSHDPMNVLECWCYKHNGCELCISNHIGDSSIWTVIDFDGTWFRLRPKHAPECTINCWEAKRKGCKVGLWNDKHPNSMFKIVDDDGWSFRLAPKHAPETTLNVAEGKPATNKH